MRTTFSILLLMSIALASQLCAGATPLTGVIKSVSGQSIPKVKVLTFAPLQRQTKLMGVNLSTHRYEVMSDEVLCLALVIWAVASRRLSNKLRRASLVIVILLTCGASTLIRTGGATSKFAQDFHWRWSKTPEERLLAQAADEQAALASAPATPSSTLSTSPGAETGLAWLSRS